MSLLLIILGVTLIAGAVALVVVLLHHQIRVAPQAEVSDGVANGQARVTQLTATQLQDELKAEYSERIHVASEQFSSDLKVTSTKLSEEVQRLTSKVIEEELGAYQQTLEEVRKVATQTMQQIHDSVEGQRVELRIKLEEEMAAERLRLVEQFDARVGDVIGAYVAESLGTGVDLGAQLHYIIETLEANKADLRKDLIGEA